MVLFFIKQNNECSYNRKIIPLIKIYNFSLTKILIQHIESNYIDIPTSTYI